MKKKKEKREAPTLSSKAMFMFGKISTRIYEKRARERESKKMKLHTHTHTQNEREREQSSLCMRQEENRIKRLNENSVDYYFIFNDYHC
jgi:hypothetical protein